MAEVILAAGAAWRRRRREAEEGDEGSVHVGEEICDSDEVICTGESTHASLDEGSSAQTCAARTHTMSTEGAPMRPFSVRSSVSGTCLVSSPGPSVIERDGEYR